MLIIILNKNEKKTITTEFFLYLCFNILNTNMLKTKFYFLHPIVGKQGICVGDKSENVFFQTNDTEKLQS